MSAPPADRYDPLVERLGVAITDRSLLDRAFAHRSWCAENPGNASNERLEFLGDAVLGWIVADLAFERFPEMTEGDLTGVRKGVVNAVALSELAIELDLGAHVKLGKGEAAAGGSAKPSILADVMEAVIGAVYVDCGAATAHEFIERILGERIDDMADHLDELDFKSTLQELLSADGRPAPVYEIAATGPDHRRLFTATVVVGGEVLGTGDGRTKRAAEQAAAAVATNSLAGNGDGLGAPAN